MTPPPTTNEHLWLVGLTGVGKTSIGKRVAARTGLAFFDTDAEVSRQTNLSVADYWEAHGEAAFRALEIEAVATAAGLQEASVIATGGGAVLAEVSRTRMRTGRVVWLTMDLDALADHLANKTRRPVLDGDLRARLGELMEDRARLYGEVADWTVDGTHRSRDSVADEVALWWAARERP